MTMTLKRMRDSEQELILNLLYQQLYRIDYSVMFEQMSEKTARPRQEQLHKLITTLHKERLYHG